MKSLERFDWRDALLTETVKETVEDNLVEYDDIFAGQYRCFWNEHGVQDEAHTKR